MIQSLRDEAPLSEKIIPWADLEPHAAIIEQCLEEHKGRLVMLIHTGGGCLGSYRNEQYYPVFAGADIYLQNIRRAIAEETSVIVFLGAFFQTIADVRTKAIGIDLPSARDIPIPDLGQELRWEDFDSWKQVIETLKSHGAKSISPFGGEIASWRETYIVKGGCVNGALRQINEGFPVTVYPQLCGDEAGNKHIQTDAPLSLYAYEAIP